ncbi:hypothetical protein JCM10213_007200 [Rhodosporidiobolus nylandii]
MQVDQQGQQAHQPSPQPPPVQLSPGPLPAIAEDDGYVSPLSPRSDGGCRGRPRVIEVSEHPQSTVEHSDALAEDAVADFWHCSRLPWSCSERPKQPSPAPSAGQQANGAGLPASPGSLAAPPAPSDAAQKGRMDDHAEATLAATTLANVAAAAAAASSATPPASAAPASAPVERAPGTFDPAAPNAVNGLPNPLPANYDKSQPICANCATQTTPLWRRSHDSTHILCNACALFFKMKGRPRPISLKTDVIKSRNRSKGKSTSKDRGGKAANSTAAALASPAARGVSKDRSESMTRGAGEGRKSAPGGAGADEDQAMKEGRTKAFGDAAMSEGGKVRKMMPTPPMPPYGLPYPGYPYPYPYPHGPHPHGHQPYPPPRSRSRSSDPTRRGQSVDARARGVGGATPEGAPTPPAAPGVPPHFPYPPYPGLVPGAPPPEGYPPYPFYPYGPPPPGFNPAQPPHFPYPAPPYALPPAALAHAAQQAALHPSAGLTHAQSDSRSHSPAPDSRPASTRGSPSPPQASAAPTPIPPVMPAPPSWYPHPNPNYHLHQPHTHSPLAGPRPLATRTPSSVSNPPSKPVTPADEAKPLDVSGRLAPPGLLGAAPRNASSSGSEAETVRGASEEKASQASFLAAAPPAPFPAAAAAAARLSNVNIFGAPPPSSLNAEAGPSQLNATRERRASVSSASPSADDSSEGVRSPETTSRALAPSWGSLNGPAAGGTPGDERRGRPEKRFDGYPLPGNGKGKERDSSMNDVDEVDELEDEAAASTPGSGSSQSRARMNGVETGINELRVSQSGLAQMQPPQRGLASPVGAAAAGSSAHRVGGSSRSRSRARGENERGRSRGVLGGASARSGSTTSTSRVRGSSSASSAGARGREGTAGAPAGVREHWPPEAQAEIQRLKTKISELTFLNGLMQSRLAQLEGPGRVPRNVMTSLTAETPRPDPDELLYAEDDEDEEMGRPEPIEEEVPAGFE